MTDVAILTLFPALMAFAAASDIATMTISNRVSLALVAGFFVVALAAGLPLSVIGWHVAAAALVLAIGLASSPPAGSAEVMPNSRRRPRCGSASATSWPIS